MRLVNLTFLAIFFVVSVKALAVGFTNGTDFSSSHIQGAVTVDCTDRSVNFTCYDSVLDPNNYDYFNGPEGVVADEVTLSNLREDGSRRERTEVYSVRQQRSDGAFNLWISSPFQRPLLALGKNNIDFRLLSRGKIVDQGSFLVTVTAGAPRTCPTTRYNSTDSNDCKSQYTVCQRYFEQYNYCR